MVQDGSTPADGAPGGFRRHRIALVALVVVFALVVAVVIYGFEGAKGYYTIAPGTAPVVSDSPGCREVSGGSFSLPNGRACVRLDLPAGKAGSGSGSVMMVDVLVGPASWGDFILSRVGLLHRFRDGTILVPSQEILGDTPPAQLGCQDDQQMADASSSAAVVALRRLGYPVGEHDEGAQVDQVEPGTPAATAGIECNDLVTAVDGRQVHTATDLVNAIHAASPGHSVTITVSRTGQGGKTTTMQLHAALEGTPAEGGQPAQPGQAFLGVSSETRATYTYPFPVKIQVGEIGGPSAGLALTLGLLDSLSHGQLTGGHRVAATGTIDFSGNVGDVGGVAQKAVAVRQAGAQVFLVPTQEAAEARSEAGSMKVYPVANLAQALSDLEALGGHIPPAPTTTK